MHSTDHIIDQEGYRIESSLVSVAPYSKRHQAFKV
jgi:hypothetical protein